MSQQLQPSLNNKAVPQTTPLTIKMEPVSASVGSQQPAPLKPSQFLKPVTSPAKITSPAVTAATKPQFQVMPSTANIGPATQQMKQQYTLAPTPNNPHAVFNQQNNHHHIQTSTSQPRLIPKPSQQPTTIAPKIAPRPIAVQPKVAKSLDSSLNGSLTGSSNNDKNVPCIITSKQWVLPPRPKAGRKPDKKKNSTTNKKGSNSMEIGSTPMSSTPSHGMTNLSDTLTNLNIQGSSSNTPASSVVSSLNGVVASGVSMGNYSEGSKGLQGKGSISKNSISNASSTSAVKQKELKSQLDSATLENTKLKNIIEKLKLEIEQLQQTTSSSNCSSPPISSPQTMLNSPSPLTTATTTNASSTAVATPQFLEQQPAPVTISLSELDSPDVKAMTPVQTYEPHVSPTIDPTKIDLLIQENYKMDLMMQEQEEKLKSKKAEPKKKRQYKKKKKVDISVDLQPLPTTSTAAPAVTMVKLEDTPSPLTSAQAAAAAAAVTGDALLSDLPNLTSILEDQGALFDDISPPPSSSTASASTARILDTVDEDEILHPFKRRSLKLERSVSLSDPVSSRSTASRHRQYSNPHHLHHSSHTLGRSLSNTSVGSSSVGSSFTSPDFPQDSWSHSAGAFLNEDAMFDGSAGLGSSLENQDIDMLINDTGVIGDESLNWDLLNQDDDNVLNDTAGDSVVGLSRATTLTTVDWDEEEGNFVDVGSFW